jgi:hypothetical protein
VTLNLTSYFDQGYGNLRGDRGIDQEEAQSFASMTDTTPSCFCLGEPANPNTVKHTVDNGMDIARTWGVIIHIRYTASPEPRWTAHETKTWLIRGYCGKNISKKNFVKKKNKGNGDNIRNKTGANVKRLR